MSASTGLRAPTAEHTVVTIKIKLAGTKQRVESARNHTDHNVSSLAESNFLSLALVSGAAALFFGSLGGFFLSRRSIVAVAGLAAGQLGSLALSVAALIRT